MPLTATGRDIKLTINPATGKGDLTWGDDGNPEFDDSEMHRVLSLLLEHRGKWLWFDPLGNRGSLLHTLRTLQRSTPSIAESTALEALQRGVNDGAIDSVEVKARKATTYGRLTLDVRWRSVKDNARHSLSPTIRT